MLSQLFLQGLRSLARTLARTRIGAGALAVNGEVPAVALAAAEEAAQACDLMLVVGTAGAVYPAAGLAHQARAAGGRVVVLNPAPSALDEVAHQVLKGMAATLLPQLLDD